MKQSVNLNITPENLVSYFTPKKGSLKWFKHGIKNWWRESRIKSIFTSIIVSIISLKLNVEIFMNNLFSGLNRTLIALSNGIAILYQLFCVAFIWMIDRELWEEIKKSQMARQALGFGSLVTIIWCVYVFAEVHHFSIYVVAFSSYQFVRGIRFLGMEPRPKAEPEITYKRGATRSIKTIEDVIDEREEDPEFWYK